MRKVFLFVVMLFTNMMLTFAQDDIILYITDYPTSQHLCMDNNQRVIIHAQPGCEGFRWTVNGQVIVNETPLIIDPQDGNYWYISYLGFDCDYFQHTFVVEYHESNIPNGFTQVKWKRQAEMDSLVAIGQDSIGYPFNYEFIWTTGETSRTINVTDPGTYSCEITGLCGTATRSFIVRDNVELYRATCDLRSNLNQVTWLTTPAQAAYISQVIIKRDGMQVGTAPYEDGQFIDNIGSDAASRTYTIIGVMPNGEQCPIESYPKETIHMSYLLGVGGTIDLTWNTPTGYDLMGYNICEWNPNGKDGELTVIDYVGAGVTSYTCFESQFNNGNIVVQGVEEGKSESRLLSNRSWETVGIDEIEISRFAIYPNPSNGMITIRGTGILTISNMIGQTIFQQEIDGESFVELPAGVYVAKLGNSVQKVVVE